MPPVCSHTPFELPISCSASVLGNLKPDLCRGLCQLVSVEARLNPHWTHLQSLVYYHQSVKEIRPTCIQYEGEVTAMSLRQPVACTQRTELSSKAGSRSLGTLETLACRQSIHRILFPQNPDAFGGAIVRFWRRKSRQTRRLF